MGKRKASESEVKPDSKTVKIKIANISEDTESPVLATFPGTIPSSETVFTPYKRNYETGSAKANERVIVGETEKVLFTGSNFGENGPRGVYCDYYVGVYSKKDRQVTITPARVVSMRRNVKVLMNDTVMSNNKEAHKEQRAKLGMAFGTAKAIKQLRDEERNAVQADDILDELSQAQHEIGLATSNLPTQSELKQQLKTGLPIPKYNIDATSPEDVYDLDSIVTQEELNSIPIKELLNEESMEGVQNWLPYSRSNFVNNKVLQIITTPGKKDRKRARLLVYLSFLMAYYCKIKDRDLKSREKLVVALKDPSAAILQGLSNRYTDGNVRTPLMSDKLLCYILTLYLILSDYQLFPDAIAKELSLKSSKVQTILRNLGCKIDKSSAEEANIHGLDPKSNAKKATLVVPLTFPELSRGKRK
ncbi:RNA polymerase I associated factor, A49-like protein [Cunninghamella echinulata]|nr:RNA polymerase I associated factor, A49-like protein [Cunninghamella echinulata]